MSAAAKDVRALLSEDAPSGLSAWRQVSLRSLEVHLHRLLARLDRRVATLGGEAPASGEVPEEAREEGALAEVVQRFDLTRFERDLLLLAAGIELDSRFGERLERLQGTRLPTFSLALTVLDGGHWDALAPDGALRRGRLLAVDGPEGGSLATRPLRLEEAVFFDLLGQPQLDRRLRPYIRPLALDSSHLPAGQQRALEQVLDAWHGAEPGHVPLVQLVPAGEAPVEHALAAAACRRAGLAAFLLDLDALPADPAEQEELFELWNRDAVLGDLALVAEAGEGSPLWRRLADRVSGFTLVLGGSPLTAGLRPAIRLTVAGPSEGERKQLWQQTLGPSAEQLNGHLDRLMQQFQLPAASLRDAAAEALTTPGDSDALADSLWQACRRQARGGLDQLAQRLDAAAGWEELVLPPAQTAVLRSIAVHVRQRARVYEEWGFARQGRRGLGISALFSGPSGTGKTMAAEVLAGELGLDLYRIDLSATVSKYIGETEKNLRRIFDAAEASGAILLFDEADALFGKRSEVRDSHDRYANLEVSYLLQRIEAYRGLAVLTTNLQRNLDEAFLRRLRFVVQFPHPGPAERAEIWRRVFPPATPLDGLAPEKLARLSVTGGHIRSIALGAAVLAAEAGAAVSMGHVLSAARAEYGKLGKTLGESEIKGWEVRSPEEAG